MSPPTELSSRLSRAARLRLAGQVLQSSLGLVVLMVLARLLTPDDFGLVAVATVWATLLGTVRDFGLSMAAVEGEALEPEDLRHLVRLGLRIQGLLALLALATAPVLVAFYGDGRLLPAFLVLCLSSIFMGLAAAPRGLLVRETRFGALVSSEVGGTFLATLFAVGLGVAGAGWWALVGYHVCRSATVASLYWTHGGRRAAGLPEAGLPEAAQPVRGGLSTRPIRSSRYFHYGSRLTLARMVQHAGRSVDRALLGYFASTSQVGFYHQAAHWAQTPQQHLFGPLVEVNISGLARMRADPARFTDLLTRALRLVYTLAFPVLGFLIVEPDLAVRFLMGEGWRPAMPLLRILSLGALFTLFSQPTTWLFLATGDVGRMLRWHVLSATALGMAVAATAPFGVRPVAVAFASVSVLLALPAWWAATRANPASLREPLEAAWVPALATAGAAVLLTAVSSTLPDRGALIPLLTHGSLFVLTYCLLVLGLGWRSGSGQWLRGALDQALGRTT